MRTPIYPSVRPIKKKKKENITCSTRANMRFFKTALSTALFVTSVLCQGIVINSPSPGTTITPGSNITVSVGMSDFPENIETVGMAIGLQSCNSSIPCGPPLDDGVSTVLYIGPWNPSFGSEYSNIYQDFNVTIPSTVSSGAANLAAVGYYLVGASNIPTLAPANASLTVA
ncbi:hypothetical protein F5I97DRAFT_1906292 [Phlebopus sp. FC_14]|nr:hypothetical protein F5I97DRAFT_1906292 [Phlebopus sp. FC_14]